MSSYTRTSAANTASRLRTLTAWVLVGFLTDFDLDSHRHSLPLGEARTGQARYQIGQVHQTQGRAFAITGSRHTLHLLWPLWSAANEKTVRHCIRWIVTVVQSSRAFCVAHATKQAGRAASCWRPMACSHPHPRPPCGRQADKENANSDDPIIAAVAIKAPQALALPCLLQG